MAQTSTAASLDEEEPQELEERLSEIFRDFQCTPDDLIPVLHRVQGALGYLPEKALLEVADAIGLPPAKVFGVATFYTLFRLQPVGKHIIRVCRGTACHVRGSRRILEDVQAQLGVGPGGTTRDRLFTLETVACFGSCALAPVVVVDGRVYGRMNASKVRTLLDEVRAEAGEDDGLRIHEGQG